MPSSSRSRTSTAPASAAPRCRPCTRSCSSRSTRSRTRSSARVRVRIVDMRGYDGKRNRDTRAWPARAWATDCDDALSCPRERGVLVCTLRSELTGASHPVPAVYLFTCVCSVCGANPGWRLAYFPCSTCTDAKYFGCVPTGVRVGYVLCARPLHFNAFQRLSTPTDFLLPKLLRNYINRLLLGLPFNSQRLCGELEDVQQLPPRLPQRTTMATNHLLATLLTQL